MPSGVREVGYIFAFSGFIGIIMQGGVVGSAVKWLGERRVVQIGFLASLLGYAAIGFTHTVGQLLVVSGLSSICGAGLRPALTSLVTQKCRPARTGSHSRVDAIPDVDCADRCAVDFGLAD